MTRYRYLTELDELTEQLAAARRAYAEACAQEVLHRSTTLRARLSAGEPVTATSQWAEIDSSTWVAEKLRRRAEMDVLTDRRDVLLQLITYAEPSPDTE